MAGEGPEEFFFPIQALGDYLAPVRGEPTASAQPLHSHSSISGRPPWDEEQGQFSSIPFPRGEKFVKKSRKVRPHRLSEAKPPTIFKYLCLH